MVKQAFPRLGQHHAAAGAREQGNVQIGLQQPHLPGQCGLGNIQDQGGLAEAPEFGNAHEIFQLLQVHRCLLPVPSSFILCRGL